MISFSETFISTVKFAGGKTFFINYLKIKKFSYYFRIIESLLSNKCYAIFPAMLRCTCASVSVQCVNYMKKYLC